MKKIILSAALLLVGMVGNASALSFGLDSYTITANASDPGLVLYTYNILPTPYQFNLDVGQSQTVSLFRIGTDESWAGNSDDKVAKPITVAFDFSSPDVDMTATGKTFGKSYIIASVGKVEWDNPTQFMFGNTGLFTIELENGWFFAPCNTIIDATLKYVTADTPGNQPVPEPSTMLLLGAGLLGVVGYSRKRLNK